MTTKSKFDPTEHLIRLQGKDYLQVQHRVLWFRAEHPKGRIETELVSTDPLIYKATIKDSDGNILATGHGSAQRKDKAVWSGREVEKAETAATGRALGLAGFGTQFTNDFNDDDHLADSPVEPRQNAAASPQTRHSAPPRMESHSDTDGAKNGHSVSNQPTSKTVTLIPYVNVKSKSDGSYFMQLETVDRETAYCFNWHVFEDTAWCDKDEWRGKEGTYQLPTAPTAELKQQIGKAGDPYWIVEAVSKFDLLDIADKEVTF